MPSEAWWGLESFSETAGACGPGAAPRESRLPGAGSEGSPSASQMIPRKVCPRLGHRGPRAGQPLGEGGAGTSSLNFLPLAKGQRNRGRKAGSSGFEKFTRAIFLELCLCLLLTVPPGDPRRVSTRPHDPRGEGARRFDSARAPVGQKFSTAVPGLLFLRQGRAVSVGLERLRESAGGVFRARGLASAREPVFAVSKGTCTALLQRRETRFPGSHFPVSETTDSKQVWPLPSSFAWSLDEIDTTKAQINHRQIQRTQTNRHRYK